MAARLFVAVVPPPDVVDVVAAVPRPDVIALRWTTRDQWHVTLRFLGSVDDARVDDVVRAVAAAPLVGPARAVVGPATGRFGRRVLHVPVAGLEGLAAEVVRRTSAVVPVDPEESGRPFHGHLTLARARDRRGTDLGPWCDVPCTAAWDVDAVVLFESHLRPTGAVHVPRAEVPVTP